MLFVFAFTISLGALSLAVANRRQMRREHGTVKAIDLVSTILGGIVVIPGTLAWIAIILTAMVSGTN